MASTDTRDANAELIAAVKALRNVRRFQTGAKAATTQRKLEAAVEAAHAAGITDAELTADPA